MTPYKTPKEKKDKIVESKKKALSRLEKDTKLQFSDKTRVIMNDLLDNFIKAYFGLLPETDQIIKTDQT